MVEISALGWNKQALERETMVCVLDGKVETLVISCNWTKTFIVLDGDWGPLISTTWEGEYSTNSLLGVIDEDSHMVKSNKKSISSYWGISWELFNS